jgi:hypothetical protein
MLYPDIDINIVNKVMYLSALAGGRKNNYDAI